MADLLDRDELDVVGIGNALVDVLSHASDAFLAREGLVKGAMHLVDEARARRLYTAMGPAIEVSGGSAANTIVGVASFGGRAHYVGKVRDDQLGEVFSHDLRSVGVGYATPAATDGPSTGRCLIVVTPDAQRTMNTYLGASVLLGPADVDAHPVGAVVDTTGAGDLYASGFLYGLSRGLSLATCGRLGALAAAEVISHVGARPATPLAELAGALRA